MLGYFKYLWYAGGIFGLPGVYPPSEFGELVGLLEPVALWRL